jgi:D-3-phosphoglycerate dehydrogenase
MFSATLKRAGRRLKVPNTRTLSNALNLQHDYASENKAGEIRVQTYNKISPIGLAKFPSSSYVIESEPNTPNTHALMIRSYKLKTEEVPWTVRCIARCGAGTNNIPVDEMTALGIPVFNTPGANANAVKELALCGMLLASRKIVPGINHMYELGQQGVARERVEKDKALFGGREIAGKTLGVIGLGHIGAALAADAAALGMNIVGYDPMMSVNAALRLPRDTKIVDNPRDLLRDADYVSLNIPFINKPVSEGGTKHFLNAELIGRMKKDASLLNFARGELVDSEALRDHFDRGATGFYVSDFPDDFLYDSPNTLLLPHLGASTEEAEDEAASMAAQTIKRFIETGEIVNSVNFPSVKLPPSDESCLRISIVSRNEPGVLAQINSILADHKLNVTQQINKSQDQIAYNVIDCKRTDSPGATWSDLQQKITMIDEVLNTRFIAGKDTYGLGFAMKRDGKYVA